MQGRRLGAAPCCAASYSVLFFFNLRDNYLVARLDPYTFVYIARKIITIVCTAVSVWCWTGVSQQVKRTKRCRRAATPDSRCSQSATVTWNFDNKDRDTEAVRESRENSTRRYPSGVIAGIAADFGDLGRLQLRGAHWKSSQVKASLGSWSIFSISSPPFFELPVCLVCVGVGVHTHTIPAPAPAPSHSRSLSLVR